MGKYNDNPWLGLESYQEFQIIYGRNQEIEELSQCILNNTETVLYGKSGIGKTSIINAGIIPILRKHGFIPIVIRLDHSNMHSYIKQMSDQIGREVEVSECTIDKPIEEQVLWEYFHTHHFNKDVKSKLVIIFDQFEEIFTLQRNAAEKGQFFKELGDVLNDVMPKCLVEAPIDSDSEENKAAGPQSVSGFDDMADLFDRIAANVSEAVSHYIETNEIHFVFTLREDFLSEFEYHTTKIPSLKQHRYGLRPLNEEQAAEIILKPRPELVDAAVARLIIETVTNRTDFSLFDEPEIDVDAAVLSLFLNQIYDKRSTNESPVTVDLIKTFGKDIIKDFYEEAVKGLSESQVDFIEYELLTGENRRDSISRADFLAGGFSEAELKHLVEEKKILRQFHYEGDLRVELIHDILCPVVKERKEKKEIERQQEEERKRQVEEKRLMQEEAERKQRETEEKAAREKASLEAESIRIKKRNRKRLLALSSVLVFFVIAITAYYYCFEIPYSECYGNFTTKDGWPVGLGPQLASSKEKEKCTVYYKLSRNGRLNSFMKVSRPFTKVEILNWKGEPSANLFPESHFVRLIDKELYDDAKAAQFARLLSQVSYWQYIPDANGSISKKTAFDINGRELYSETYSSENNVGESTRHVLWSVFTDDKGKPLKISDNGTDRIRYIVSDGYITGCSFFTVLGTPQPNTSGDYGYAFTVDSINGNISEKYLANQFGNKNEKTLIIFSKFENGRCTESDTYSVAYSKQNVITKYKGHSDTIHVSDEGFVDYISVAINERERVSTRYRTAEELQEKLRFKDDSLVYGEKYFYSSKLDSMLVYNKDSDFQGYVEKFSYPDKNTIEQSFWRNGEKIMLTSGKDEEQKSYHKIVTTTSVSNSDSIVTCAYYDCNNALTPETNCYSKSEIIFDKNSGKNLVEYYYGPDDEICKSEMFSYNKYGIKESRAVAGIDRTPVRCPNWDWNGFSYYKMSFLKDFTGEKYVSIMGTNEFGDKSYIMSFDYVFNISDVPMVFTTTYNLNDKIKSTTFSYSLSKNNYKALTLEERHIVPFIHVLSKKSILYNALGRNNDYWRADRRDGVFDNDIPYKVGKYVLGNSINLLDEELNIIEKKGGEIQVLRVYGEGYRILTFKVSPGPLRAEIHDIFLTDKEYKNLKKYIR